MDVNEQNDVAIAFYERMGFKQIGHSELDATGRPFPIVHMELPENREEDEGDGEGEASANLARQE